MNVLQLRTWKQFESVQFYVHFKSKDTEFANRILKVKTIIFGTFGENMGKVLHCNGPPEIIGFHL